jgi:uncharacterized protein YjbJ (UPF0337 family)
VVAAGDIRVGAASWEGPTYRGQLSYSVGRVEPKSRALASKIQTRRKQMNPSTKDEIKGDLHEVKGKVKETAGKVTNNPSLEAEGKAEQYAGKVEKKVGQVEKVFEK